MVLDFGKQHYRMSSEQLEALSQATLNGDISTVMRAYEQDMKVEIVAIFDTYPSWRTI